MKNLIEELWNGERGPQDTPVDNNPHYKELQYLQSCNKAELLERLSEEQKEKLEKYCDTTLEMNSAPCHAGCSTENSDSASAEIACGLQADRKAIKSKGMVSRCV